MYFDQLLLAPRKVQQQYHTFPVWMLVVVRIGVWRWGTGLGTGFIAFCVNEI